MKVHRAALWILGEYSNSVDDIEAVMKQVHQTLGDIPLVEAELKTVFGDNNKTDEESTQTTGSASTNSKLVTSDGTYASQSAFNSTQ